MRQLRQILRCDTLEDCHRIQRGYLPIRRLGKWSILFTFALMLLFNDAIGVCVDRVFSHYEQARDQYQEARGLYENAHKEYTNVTSSALYRWTIGWVYPPVEVPSPTILPPEAPKLNERTLLLYRLLNLAQFGLFLGCCGYCLRWVYADFRAQGKVGMFSRFLSGAVVINLVLYFALRTWVVGLLG